jgi:hypothetical protein
MKGPSLCHAFGASLMAGRRVGFWGAGGLRGDGAGDGGARDDPIECVARCDAWAGWLGRDEAREGRKDGNGWVQAFELVGFGGGLGWGESRRLIKGRSFCHTRQWNSSVYQYERLLGKCSVQFEVIHREKEIDPKSEPYPVYMLPLFHETPHLSRGLSRRSAYMRYCCAVCLFRKRIPLLALRN